MAEFNSSRFTNCDFLCKPPPKSDTFFTVLSDQLLIHFGLASLHVFGQRFTCTLKSKMTFHRRQTKITVLGHLLLCLVATNGRLLSPGEAFEVCSISQIK